MVPTAAELVSGFWAGGDAAGPVDAYAAAAFLQGQNAINQGVLAPTRAWVLRADQAVSPGPDGRPTVGYPSPLEDPVWVAADVAGGPVWGLGVDFTVEDGYVWFDTDPLAVAPPGVVWVAGTPVRAAPLTYSPGTPAVAVTDPPVGSYTALVQAIAAACDSPCTGTDYETVQVVTDTLVITDAAVYTIPEADTPIVSVGDELAPGTPLGGAWSLYRLGVPLPDLDRVTLPADFFPLSTVASPVSFINDDVAVTVDTEDDRTRIRWALGGSQLDVDAVWTASHEWGILAGNLTLAQALDTRANPTTEPTVADLPTSVNPMGVLCRELFAGTAYLLLVDSAKLGPAAVSTAARVAAVATATSPFATVVEWVDGQPAPAQTSPTL